MCGTLLARDEHLVERFGVAPVKTLPPHAMITHGLREYPMPNTQQALTLSLVRDTGVDPETLSFIFGDGSAIVVQY